MKTHKILHFLCPLILVALLWGCTNPFLKRGSKGIIKIKSNTIPGQLYAELVYLLFNWKYVLPFVINQLGSLLYLAALQSAQLSLAVPVANSLTFVFTAVTGWVLGEEPLNYKSILGICLIIMGTTMCVLST